MDFLDLQDPEAAARRMRRRMAREEARRLARRKLAIGSGAVGIALIAALAFGLLSRPAGVDASQSRPEVAEASASAVPEPVPVTVVETPAPDPVPVAEPDLEQAPEPEPKPEPEPEPKPAAKPSTQKVSIDIGGAGYEPSVVTVKAGRPVRITVAKGEGCAAGFYLPQLGVEKDNSNGPVTFTLDPLEPGSYTFTCGMGMVSGELVVE